MSVHKIKRHLKALQNQNNILKIAVVKQGLRFVEMANAVETMAAIKHPKANPARRRK